MAISTNEYVFKEGPSVAGQDIVAALLSAELPNCLHAVSFMPDSDCTIKVNNSMDIKIVGGIGFNSFTKEMGAPYILSFIIKEASIAYKFIGVSAKI